MIFLFFSCTAYSVASDGTCNLYDNDPENYVSATTGTGTATGSILYTVHGSPQCKFILYSTGP